MNKSISNKGTKTGVRPVPPNHILSPLKKLQNGQVRQMKMWLKI